jgi:hypothetical protein
VLGIALPTELPVLTFYLTTFSRVLGIALPTELPVLTFYLTTCPNKNYFNENENKNFIHFIQSQSIYIYKLQFEIPDKNYYNMKNILQFAQNNINREKIYILTINVFGFFIYI